jgi:hypothetical protein
MYLSIILTWIFWSLLIGLMAFWRRSFLPLFLFPILFSIIFVVLSLWSDTIAFYASAIIHGGLFFALVLISICGKKEGDDPFFSRNSKL